MSYRLKIGSNEIKSESPRAIWKIQSEASLFPDTLVLSLLNIDHNATAFIRTGVTAEFYTMVANKEQLSFIGIVDAVRTFYWEGVPVTKLWVKDSTISTIENDTLSLSVSGSVADVITRLSNDLNLPIAENEDNGESIDFRMGGYASDLLRWISKKYQYNIFSSRNKLVSYKSSTTRNPVTFTEEEIQSYYPFKEGDGSGFSFKTGYRANVMGGDIAKVKVKSSQYSNYLILAAMHVQNKNFNESRFLVVPTGVSPEKSRKLLYQWRLWVGYGINEGYNEVYDVVDQKIKLHSPKMGDVALGLSGNRTADVNVGSEDTLRDRDLTNFYPEVNRPVASPFAGDNYGMGFPILPGQRVIVDKIDGDLQKTIVRGSYWSKGQSIPAHQEGDFFFYLPTFNGYVRSGENWSFVVDRTGAMGIGANGIRLSGSLTTARPTLGRSGVVTIDDIGQFEPRAQPASGYRGDIYYDDSTNLLRLCVGAGTPGTWVNIDVAGALTVHNNTYHSPHFLPVDGTEAMAANLPMSGFSITNANWISFTQGGSTVAKIDTQNSAAVPFLIFSSENTANPIYWSFISQWVMDRSSHNKVYVRIYGSENSWNSMTMWYEGGGNFNVESGNINFQIGSVTRVVVGQSGTGGYLGIGDSFITKEAGSSFQCGSGFVPIADGSRQLGTWAQRWAYVYAVQVYAHDGTNYLRMYRDTGNSYITSDAGNLFTVTPGYTVIDSVSGHYWRLSGVNYAYINSSGDFIACYQGGTFYIYNSGHTTNSTFRYNGSDVELTLNGVNDAKLLFNEGGVNKGIITWDNAPNNRMWIGSAGKMIFESDESMYFYPNNSYSSYYIRFDAGVAGCWINANGAELAFNTPTGTPIEFKENSVDMWKMYVTSGIPVLEAIPSTSSYIKTPQYFDVWVSTSGYYMRVVDFNYNHAIFIGHDTTNALLSSNYGHIVFYVQAGSGFIFNITGTGNVAAVETNGNIVSYYGRHWVGYNPANTQYVTTFHDGTNPTIASSDGIMLFKTSSTHGFEWQVNSAKAAEITNAGRFYVVSGGRIGVYDPTNTYIMEFYDDGSAQILRGGRGNLYFMLNTTSAAYLDATSYSVLGGRTIYVFNAGNTQSMQLSQATDGQIVTTTGDLFLNPSGVVKFGSWTSGSGTVNGYITIKDAGGATIKLATIP